MRRLFVAARSIPASVGCGPLRIDEMSASLSMSRGSPMIASSTYLPAAGSRPCDVDLAVEHVAGNSGIPARGAVERLARGHGDHVRHPLVLDTPPRTS